MAIDLGNFKGEKGDQGDPGAATTVLGTNDQVDVNTSGSTATVSLSSTITDEITVNTAKTGITSNQADAIDVNTSKITYPSSASTKLGTIETNADVTDTTNVVGSLTAGNNITIAADGTISSSGGGGGGADGLSITDTTSLNLLDGATVLSTVTLPSGGGGGVTEVTGTSPITVSTGTTTPVIGFNFGVVNTFIAAQLFGTIRTNVVTGVGDSNTLLDLSVPDTLTLTAGAVDFIDCIEAGIDTLVVNSGRVDMDVDFRKNSSGSWLNYNGGTDTITFNAANIDGLPSGGTSTTVLGTAGEVTVNTVGNTATVSLPTTITGAITANTAKTGITTTQAGEITANTAKVGITTAQATAITDNTAKIDVNALNQVGAAVLSTDSIVYLAGGPLAPRRKVFSSVPLSIMNNDANFITGITKADVDTVIGDGANDTDYYASDKTWKALPSGGTSTTVLGTSNEVVVNTSGNTATVSLDPAITGAITTNNAKIGISTAQTNAITANTAKNSYPTADATKLGTIETNADVTDTDNVVGSLTAGTNITIATDGTISAASGGSATTVLGTADEIDVNTVGNTATASLNTAITTAITANTAKQSVAGLSQVGATVLSTDSVVYYAGGAQAPRRKTFSLVPNSIFNNDAGFITGITKANVDTAIGSGTADTDYYASDKTWKSIPSGGSVTKAAVDTAIGASTSGSATMFYNEQGNFVVPAGTGGVSDYDDLTDAPITRLRTVETIVLGGTRANVQEVVPGNNEFSTITMQDNFDSSGGGSTALDTSSDITYHTALQAAGRWQFANTVGFSNGMVIADGTAWSTLNGVYLGDTTLSGGIGIGNQVSVGDDIRITIGAGAATFTVDEVSTLSIVSAIRLSAATNIVGTINGISTNATTIGFGAAVLSGGGSAAQFSYDPDTNNTVYSSRIVDQEWATPGSDITTNLTYVANQIAALETNITWDGVITTIPEVSTTLTSGSTTFSNDNSGTVLEWEVVAVSIGTYTPTNGDDWSILDDFRLIENISTTNTLASQLNVGDRVRFTWGSGSAQFIVQSISSGLADFNTIFGVAENIVGTIGRTFTNNESFTLTADVITQVASSSVTLDLGTETNINSSYIVTGGLNNAETLVNTDGIGDTLAGVATTITVTDGDGMEVTSFTSSVTSSTVQNVDTVGQQIANAVNNNTETPIDFTATYTAATNTLVFTAAEASVTSPNPWVITINNNSATLANAGDLSIALQAQDRQVANELDGSIITFSNGSQTIALPSPPASGTVTLQSVDGVLSWV